MIAACLPPREVSRPKVTPEHLFELFQKWTPDQATRRKHPRDKSANLLGSPN
jgi:hypothetical protein